MVAQIKYFFGNIADVNFVIRFFWSQNSKDYGMTCRAVIKQSALFLSGSSLFGKLSTLNFNNLMTNNKNCSRHEKLAEPIALRMAKTPSSFGHSECNRIMVEMWISMFFAICTKRIFKFILRLSVCFLNEWDNLSKTGSMLNPFALITAKTLWSFGCSECNRVNCKNLLLNGVLAVLSAIGLKARICSWRTKYFPLSEPW